jgi:hypothetical protein
MKRMTTEALLLSMIESLDDALYLCYRGNLSGLAFILS